MSDGYGNPVTAVYNEDHYNIIFEVGFQILIQYSGEEAIGLGRCILLLKPVYLFDRLYF